MIKVLIVFLERVLSCECSVVPFSERQDVCFGGSRVPERHGVFREAVKGDVSLQVYSASLLLHSVGFVAKAWISEWRSVGFCSQSISDPQLTLGKISRPLCLCFCFGRWG